jgi:hypothetical protein
MNKGQLLGYQKILMPHGQDEPSEGKDIPDEQTDKIRTYKIIDTLYKFIMAYR